MSDRVLTADDIGAIVKIIEANAEARDAWVLLRDLLPHVAAIWSDHPSWRSEWSVTE